MKLKKSRLLLVILLISILTAGAGIAAGENNEDGASVPMIDLTTAIQVDLNEFQDLFSISQSGTYVLTGKLVGSVKIQAHKTDMVHLVMNNAEIESLNGPAIEGLQARQVNLTLAEDSHNTVSSASLVRGGKKDGSATIDMVPDLIIGGSGSLEVASASGHGITSKGSLLTRAGDLFITSLKVGLRAKNSVQIQSGNINVVSGSDGIVCSSSKDGQGTIRIDGGSITVTAGQDAIQAESSLVITGGSFDIFTGKGGTAVHFVGGEPAQAQPEISGHFPSRSSLIAYPHDETGYHSKKGFKANTSIEIYGGVFKLSTQDDAISSKGEVLIHGGDISILSGDDGICAQDHLHIKNGNIKILGCREGLESQTITIDGGSIDITASDDGINAAHPKGKSELYIEDVWIAINGGMIQVIAGSDAIDTNGRLTITGGTVDLTIKYFGKGNAAIDTDAGYFYVGGQVTTNDGSENAYLEKRP